VLQDPRIKATPSDWKEQQAYLEKVTGSIGDMHRSVNDLRKVRTRLEQLGGSLSDDTATAALRSKGRSIIGQIDAWESEIVETRIRNGQDVINWPSKLNAEYFNLKGLADAHDPEITAGMKERLADLEGRWKESQKELEGIRTSIAEYNEMYRKSGTPAIRYR
jgi:chromosome segregation ATPase